MKKRILISAAGTATAFHLSELIRTKFSDKFSLYLCDTNPPHLVSSAVFADHVFTVPPVKESGWRQSFFEIFEAEQIDIYVPLIDQEIYAFPSDDPQLVSLGVRSVAPPAQSSAILNRKTTWTNYLRSKNIGVPRLFSSGEIALCDPTADFFVKPENGWGSKGVGVMNASTITKLTREGRSDLLVQEICRPPEVTVEVYNRNGQLSAISRERLETKCGVCTKARLWFDGETSELARRLCAAIELPVAFCFQIMKNFAGDWVVTDLNARLGAGTSLSSTAGWSLAEAALMSWAELPGDPSESLTEFKGDRFVVRAYRDIRTR